MFSTTYIKNETTNLNGTPKVRRKKSNFWGAVHFQYNPPFYQYFDYLVIFYFNSSLILPTAVATLLLWNDFSHKIIDSIHIYIHKLNLLNVIQ